MMLLDLAAGKLTVVDIMVMMDSFIVDMVKERHLVRLTLPVIQLVAVSTMQCKSSFSRKIDV